VDTPRIRLPVEVSCSRSTPATPGEVCEPRTATHILVAERLAHGRAFHDRSSFRAASLAQGLENFQFVPENFYFSSPAHDVTPSAACSVGGSGANNGFTLHNHFQNGCCGVAEAEGGGGGGGYCIVISQYSRH
jgi:hypothetical protein